jgi:DNA-binding NarL/FixJ family response regulator
MASILLYGDGLCEANNAIRKHALARSLRGAECELDLARPHLNGLETARRLRAAVPQTKIVLLTVHTEDPYVLEALQAGAVGYVLGSATRVMLAGKRCFVTP